jgi:F420-dependent oxidoreductase-like protein
MIEGQDGLNWERWKRLLQTAEDGGFQCVFRSDHFSNAAGVDKDSLELWTSLTFAATFTERIEFGPLVTPMTFRHPSMTVRYAAAVDDLSEGRLVLGMGAGWQEREHKKFGVPFYDFPTRFAMLEEALDIVSRLFLTDGPVDYVGKHYTLEDAQLLPRPRRPGGPPILIGGNGPKQTLPLAAKYAEEWNALYIPLETFKERNALLDELLKQFGREPDDIKRSLMVQAVFGKDDAALKSKIDAISERTGSEVTVESLLDRGFIVGTPPAFTDCIGAFVEAGVQRFMLQWLDQDDIDGLEAIARDVLPHFNQN